MPARITSEFSSEAKKKRQRLKLARRMVAMSVLSPRKGGNLPLVDLLVGATPRLYTKKAITQEEWLKTFKRKPKIRICIH